MADQFLLTPSACAGFQTEKHIETEFCWNQRNDYSLLFLQYWWLLLRRRKSRMLFPFERHISWIERFINHCYHPQWNSYCSRFYGMHFQPLHEKIPKEGNAFAVDYAAAAALNDFGATRIRRKASASRRATITFNFFNFSIFFNSTISKRPESEESEEKQALQDAPG